MADDDLTQQLAEATARGDHFARLLTALVATSGPVQISAEAYEAADPSALVDVPAFVAGRPVIIYVLAEQAFPIIGKFVGSDPTTGEAPHA